MVGRGNRRNRENLELRHSVLRFPPFRGLACWVPEHNTAICVVTRTNERTNERRKSNWKMHVLRMGIESTNRRVHKQTLRICATTVLLIIYLIIKICIFLFQFNSHWRYKLFSYYYTLAILNALNLKYKIMFFC